MASGTPIESGLPIASFHFHFAGLGFESSDLNCSICIFQEILTTDNRRVGVVTSRALLPEHGFWPPRSSCRLCQKHHCTTHQNFNTAPHLTLVQQTSLDLTHISNNDERAAGSRLRQGACSSCLYSPMSLEVETWLVSRYVTCVTRARAAPGDTFKVGQKEIYEQHRCRECVTSSISRGNCYTAYKATIYSNIRNFFKRINSYISNLLKPHTTLELTYRGELHPPASLIYTVRHVGSIPPAKVTPSSGRRSCEC